MIGRTTTLRAAAEVILGRQRAPQHADGPHMTRYLRAANVKDGFLDLNDVQLMNFTPKEQATFSLMPGDVLVTEGSGSLGSVGASAVWREDLAGTVCFQNTLIRLRPRDGVDARWLYWWARSAFASGAFASIASGANIYHLSAERVRALPVKMVGRDQQRHIAAFLDIETARIERLAAIREQQASAIQKRYSAALSELVIPGIFEEVTRNPRWPWLPASIYIGSLKYFARVRTGVTVHGARGTTEADVEVPYLRVANVQGGSIDLSEVKIIKIPAEMARRSSLRKGDVVITEANGNPDNLGRGAVWQGEVENMVHQNHVFAIRTDHEKLIPSFLEALLASSHGRLYFKFTSAQVGIATTSSFKVLDFPIPIMDVQHQERVVEECRRLRDYTDQTLSAMRRQLALLAERRQALITAAVTGEFDVSTASGRGIDVA